MVAVARTLRVRLSVRSALALVFALGLTFLLLVIAHDAERVIAWALSAMAIAASDRIMPHAVPAKLRHHP